MGYCPYVYRSSGSPVYLPVPLSTRNTSIPARISTAEAPLVNGTLATAAVKDKTAYTLSGLLCIGNPQNGNAQMTTAADIYTRMATMTAFFLGQSSLSFALVIAEIDKKVTHNSVAFEYPPIGIDIVYYNCIALSLSFEYAIDSPKPSFTYSLGFTVPNRSIT